MLLRPIRALPIKATKSIQKSEIRILFKRILLLDRPAERLWIQMRATLIKSLSEPLRFSKYYFGDADW